MSVRDHRIFKITWSASLPIRSVDQDGPHYEGHAKELETRVWTCIAASEMIAQAAFNDHMRYSAAKALRIDSVESSRIDAVVWSERY